MHRTILTALTLAVGMACPWPSLAMTYTVTSTADSGTNTLRWAIQQSNASVGVYDTINFSVGASATITLSSALDQITDRVFISGDYSTIISSPGSDLFSLAADNCIIQGLALVDAWAAVRIFGSNNRIRACRIGTTWSDQTGRGNATGVADHGANNLIGDESGPWTYIAGNTSYGIYSNGEGLIVRRNYIGLDSTGTPLPNGAGIYLANAKRCWIGGDFAAFQYNVISGNTAEGVYLDGGDTVGNTISANLIGSNQYGIRVRDAKWNWIGLTAANRGNTIVGNSLAGVRIENNLARPHHNFLFNNRIGLNANDIGIPNQTGVSLSGADLCLIGGLQNDIAFERNTISGNQTYGIYLNGGVGNTISGNFIGTNSAGTARVPNDTGIYIINASGTLVGGPNTDATHVRGNVISGNTNTAALVYGSGNTLAGNTFGLNRTGTAALGPQATGIELDGPGHSVGGSDPAMRNVISGFNFGLGMYSGCSKVRVNNNFIGTDASGTIAISNAVNSINVIGADGNLIGGLSAAERNVIIPGPGTFGVAITNSAFGNTVVGNWIGVFSNGGVYSGTYNTGVYLSAADNWVGLPGVQPGNLIAKAFYGILVDGATSLRNGLYGNTLCAFSTSGIFLTNGGNGGKAAPSITSAYTDLVQGTCASGDYIEVFKAESRPGQYGGSLSFLGAVLATGSTTWSVPVAGLAAGDYVTALATDTNRNTSSFALNAQVQAPPTATSTPTRTPMPTVSVTSTVTATPTGSTTATISPTRSATATISPTRSATPTITATLTVTATPANPLQGLDLGAKGVLAFPNPARDRMTFAFHLDAPATVRIEVYNAAGERVATLAGDLPAGQGQSLSWSLQDVAPGVYQARFMVNGSPKATLKVAVTK